MTLAQTSSLFARTEMLFNVVVVLFLFFFLSAWLKIGLVLCLVQNYLSFNLLKFPYYFRVQPDIFIQKYSKTNIMKYYFNFKYQLF